MKKVVILMAILSTVYSCSQKASKPVGLESSPVVAQRVVSPQGDTLVIANMELMTDTIDFPMSLLFSEFELVKLEDKEEALVGNEALTFVSPSYIGVYSSFTGYKLFNKQGEYLTNISKKGQGPDEYPTGVGESFIDEDSNCVYLTYPAATKILAFDFHGKPANHIQLAYGNIKRTTSFFDKERQHLYVLNLAFNEDEPIIWKQDLQGNMLKQLPAKHLAAIPNYSNWLDTHLNTTAIDFAIGYYYADRVDTLYHYDENSNHLIPVFTTNLDCLSNFHQYIELPDYYCIFVNAYLGSDGWRGYALIDKHTLKGSYVRFKLDMLGDIDIPRGNMIDHGYYKTCIHPYVLQEQWMKKGEIKGLPEGIDRFVKYLQTHDVEEMNNVVLIGKLKQSKDEEFVLHDMSFIKESLK